MATNQQQIYQNPHFLPFYYTKTKKQKPLIYKDFCTFGLQLLTGIGPVTSALPMRRSTD